MTRVVTIPLAALAVVLLAGCSSSYHPFNGDTGYSDAMVAPNQYEISYVGRSNGTTTGATRLALVRAAELAVRTGHPYFELEHNQDGQRQNATYMPPTIDWYPGGYYRHGRWFGYEQPYWTPGYYDYYTQPQTTLQVKMLDQPTATSLAAKDVLRDAIDDGIKVDPAIAAQAGLKVKK